MGKYCCNEMENNLNKKDMGIIYYPIFREYGILYTDGGTSFQVIAYCPWCSHKLPSSLRNEWFDKVEKMGLEPDDASIPEEFLSAQWWK